MPVFKVLILLIGFSRVARDGGFAGGGWLISTNYLAFNLA
jgi:hypothetical protein